AVVRYDVDGSLDPTFDADGKVVTSFGGPLNAAHGRDVAVQADGKIVVAGDALAPTTTFDTNNFALARYNPDGSLDRLADGTGKVTTPFGAGDESGQAVAIDANGRIVVAGQVQVNGSPSVIEFGVARYNPDGSL